MHFNPIDQVPTFRLKSGLGGGQYCPLMICLILTKLGFTKKYDWYICFVDLILTFGIMGALTGARCKMAS